MVDEVFLSGKALGAVGAVEGQFTGVLPHMVVQMLLASERARAERTLVWRFSRVLSAQQSTFRFGLLWKQEDTEHFHSVTCCCLFTMKAG